MAVLLMVLVMSVYEFIVYRLVSHRSFYNKSFNISIAALPFFIATIILCLQSNLVITLGTIGALAIIRYRTAVKDPVDMLYILWSVHTGIVCGCQLYEVSASTFKCHFWPEPDKIRKAFLLSKLHMDCLRSLR